MMPTRRRLLRAATLLFAVATVSFAAASMNEWWRGLPPPEECSKEDLVRWMATKDLSLESPATRQAFVRRLEAELRQGIDTASIEGRLTADQQRRFASNLRLVLRDWFEAAARAYAALDAPEQARFIDDKIAGMGQWDLASLTALLRSGDDASGSPPDKFAALTSLNSEIARWIENAEANQRDQLQSFASALRMRLLARAFQRSTSSS